MILRSLTSLLIMVTVMSSCTIRESKECRFSYVDESGDYNDYTERSTYNDQSINITDSSEARNFLNSQYATLEKNVASCNALVVFIQDTVTKKQLQAQTMNVSMSAGEKIKNVDLTQNNENNLNSFEVSYRLLNNISKSLNINIGRFNAVYKTTLPNKIVVFDNGRLVVSDIILPL